MAASSDHVFVLLARIRTLGLTYSHAMTIKKVPKGLACFDSANTCVKLTHVDRNCASYWDLQGLLRMCVGLQLYVFAAETPSADYEYRREILESIMTGVPRE